MLGTLVVINKNIELTEKKNLIGFFGIGAIVVLSISAIAYFFEFIIKNTFLIINIQPLENYWLTQIISLIIFCLLSFFSINWIYNHIEYIVNNILKMLIVALAIYFFSQVLQFLGSYYFYPYVINNFLNNYEEYHNYLEPIFHAYSSITIYVKYIIFALIIWIKIKKTTINNALSRNADGSANIQKGNFE